MKIRCRNCGVWHATETCTLDGPMHPAGGLTAADYQKQADLIADRVAMDIVNEHLGQDSEEGEPVCQ